MSSWPSPETLDSTPWQRWWLSNIGSIGASLMSSKWRKLRAWSIFVCTFCILLPEKERSTDYWKVWDHKHGTKLGACQNQPSWPLSPLSTGILWPLIRSLPACLVFHGPQDFLQLISREKAGKPWLPKASPALTRTENNLLKAGLSAPLKIGTLENKGRYFKTICILQMAENWYVPYEKWTHCCAPSLWEILLPFSIFPTNVCAWLWSAPRKKYLDEFLQGRKNLKLPSKKTRGFYRIFFYKQMDPTLIINVSNVLPKNKSKKPISFLSVNLKARLVFIRAWRGNPLIQHFKLRFSLYFRNFG